MSYRLNPRLIYIVIDGGSDSLKHGSTSFELADTPNLDMLARRAIGGLMYVVGEGVSPESDVAVFSLLGYDPRKYYVGRGVTEVYGLGERLVAGREVAFRGNLVSLDDEGRIIDRRCGRDVSTEEAEELTGELRYIELDIYDGYAKVLVGVGYRLAIIIGSRRYELSDNVSNTDPAYKRIGKLSHAVRDYEPYPIKCRPLDDSEKSIITSRLVDRFLDIAGEKLARHPLNSERVKAGKPPCNYILLRDAGVRPYGLPLFKHLHGFRMGAVVEMPVERGIASLIGLAIGEAPPPSRDKSRDYPLRVRRAIDLLEFVDAIYIHLKGPDEYGHDGDKEGKIKAIEDVDRYFLSPLLDEVDLDDTAILVTCDHSTPPEEGGHTDDPVPVMLYIPIARGDGFKFFGESEFKGRGSIGILKVGWDLIPIVKRMLWGPGLAT